MALLHADSAFRVGADSDRLDTDLHLVLGARRALVAGGGLKTGRYLQTPNAVQTRLLVSSCQLMGLPEVQNFGTTGIG